MHNNITVQLFNRNFKFVCVNVLICRCTKHETVVKYNLCLKMNDYRSSKSTTIIASFHNRVF